MKVGPGSAAMKPPIPPAIDIDSKDILARTEVADSVTVKHILIAWKDLAPIYGPRMDKRAAARTNEDAVKLAKELYEKLKADPTQIDALVKDNSEDPGSLTGEPYTVEAKSQFVPEFKNLALRLKEKEVGIVKTQFGYHVMERVPPPPPDPLESADILARTPEDGPVWVQHVLIGWKDVPAAKQRKVDDRAAKRTKADADKDAKAVFDRLKKGEDMAKVMKEMSEDPGSKDDGKPYEVKKDSQLVPTFKNLSLRLKMDEVGMVISPFGWHIIKRVKEPPPPPPDPLDSTDILARKDTAAKVKVKHILLGWDKVHPPGDPVGEKRSRADLEKLVKDTVAKLKKGDKIEPLMKELSEDPGSKDNGQAYDVSADAQMVPPFKNLSLRLKVGETGVVKSEFGIHIIQRTE
jgi:parvulin-like peptidyl-prolyl isomerase